MSQARLKFPKDFLWGAAVSSYQVEGGIENCDWSKDFPAGKACDYYNRYEKYFDLARKLNHNVHRFSLEWSRIQPEEGRFDRREIEHYRKMLLALRRRKIKSMVTIWHWTLPLWLSRRGGWQNRQSPNYFDQFVRFVVQELDDLVDFWITINEPMIYISLAYLFGEFPPHKRNILKSLEVFRNLVKAHKKAYVTIHDFNRSAKVGVARNCAYITPFRKDSIFDNCGVLAWKYLHNRLFYDFTDGFHDYLGVNYYFHNRIRFTPLRFPFFACDNENKNISDLGWEIYPRGIYYVLMYLKEYNLPIYITENGIADAADRKREKFIKEHLKWVHKAISEGANVRGYLYWSLIDNFEWTHGFEPRLGLVEMKYKTLETKVRRSAYEYARICEKNEVVF